MSIQQVVRTLLCCGVVVFCFASGCPMLAAQAFPGPSASPTPFPNPSPTPVTVPSPTPSPSPSPSPTPDQCSNPLQSLDPVSLGLDPASEDPILTPTDDSNSAFSKYVIGGAFISTDIVGVVLPRYGGYTISPNASTTPDLTYDVSGCWGPNGAMVFAQAGLYTFLAVDPTQTHPVITTGTQTTVAADQTAQPAEAPQLVNAQALKAKALSDCFTDPPALAKAKAAAYDPKAATVAGGKTGLMIDDTNDAAIKLAQGVFDSQTVQYEKVGGGANTAVQDMVANIGNVFTNNGNNPITAVEVGHGNPNTWTNVGSVFSINYGTAPPTPSDALKALEAGAKGKVDFFDVFSCNVAKGVAPPPNGNLNWGHILTHIAINLVPAAGTAVSVRGVNVPIFIIPARRGIPGSFALKNTDKDTKNAVEATVKCQNNPVQCFDPPALNVLLP
jgi:hypothetical protein